MNEAELIEKGGLAINIVLYKQSRKEARQLFLKKSLSPQNNFTRELYQNNRGQMMQDSASITSIGKI